MEPPRAMPNEEFDRMLRQLISEVVLCQYSNGSRRFLSGGAVGFDLIAAEEVMALRELHPDILLILVVPFEGQDAKYSRVDKLRYRKVWQSADEIVVISDEGFSMSAYHQRNDYMVRHSSCVMAYNNGMVNGRGTQATLRMAARQGVEIINLYDILSQTGHDRQLLLDL